MERVVARGAVHGGHDEEEQPISTREDAEHEQGVGRADDLDVEAVGGVPPVVEGGGGEHGDAAPGGEEGAERAGEAEHAARRWRAGRGILAQGGVEDQVATGDAGENAAEIDGHVGGRPEGVAADGAVPGDVPVGADGYGGDGEGRTPEVPGNRSSLFGRLGHRPRESRHFPASCG